MANLGIIKNGGFLKPILTNLIWKKLRKIGDGWKDLQKIFHLGRVPTLSLKRFRSYSNLKNTILFSTLTVYHKKQFANNFIATKMIEDFVRLPWNFRWCLTCVSFGTGSNFVRIGNCFLWFLHDPLLCLVKIPEKWCNSLKNLHLFLNGLSWYSDYSFERGPKI